MRHRENNVIRDRATFFFGNQVCCPPNKNKYIYVHTLIALHHFNYVLVANKTGVKVGIFLYSSYACAQCQDPKPPLSVTVSNDS